MVWLENSHECFVNGDGGSHGEEDDDGEDNNNDEVLQRQHPFFIFFYTSVSFELLSSSTDTSQFLLKQGIVTQHSISVCVCVCVYLCVCVCVCVCEPEWGNVSALCCHETAAPSAHIR